MDELVLIHTHPPLLPVSSCGQFEIAINRTTLAPSARTEVGVAHKLTPLRTGNETLGLVPCIPSRFPTAVTSLALLVPLVRFLGTWLVLPSLSQWLRQTIRLGYAIQFTRCPTKFRDIHFTTVYCVQRSQSCWRRIQWSRSFQPM